jgi:hypothetical protein
MSLKQNDKLGNARKEMNAYFLLDGGNKQN